jgi:predicted Zn-dependent protease
MSGSGGQAQFSGGAYNGDMNAYIGSVFKAVAGTSTTLNYGNVSRTTINGLSAGYASATAATQSGQVSVTVYGYEFANNLAFHVLTISPATSASPFSSLFQSVRRLSSDEIAAIRPRKINIVTVRSSDTLKSLSDRMAYSDYKMERFLVLNGLKADSVLRSGQKIKIIIFG